MWYGESREPTAHMYNLAFGRHLASIGNRVLHCTAAHGIRGAYQALRRVLSAKAVLVVRLREGRRAAVEAGGGVAAQAAVDAALRKVTLRACTIGGGRGEFVRCSKKELPSTV